MADCGIDSRNLARKYRVGDVSLADVIDIFRSKRLMKYPIGFVVFEMSLQKVGRKITRK